MTIFKVCNLIQIECNQANFSWNTYSTIASAPFMPNESLSFNAISVLIWLNTFSFTFVKPSLLVSVNCTCAVAVVVPAAGVCLALVAAF